MKLPRGCGNRYHATGFTLVEVLVGMTMFAVIAASVYSSLYLGIKLWRQQERTEAQLQSGLLAVEMLAGILRNTYVNSRNEQVLFSGLPQEVVFFAVNTDGDVEEVQLYLETSEQQPAVLYLKRRLLRDLEKDEDVPAEPVLLRVKDLRWQYYDDAAGIWNERWDAGPLPPAQVKLSLSLAVEPPADAELVLEKYVYLPTAGAVAEPEKKSAASAGDNEAAAAGTGQ